MILIIANIHQSDWYGGRRRPTDAILEVTDVIVLAQPKHVICNVIVGSGRTVGTWAQVGAFDQPQIVREVLGVKSCKEADQGCIALPICNHG